MCLTRPRLRFADAGPRSVLRPLLPKVPNGGIENALVLNHASCVGAGSEGLPVTFGRSLYPNPRFDRPVLLLSISGSSITVNGRPLCAAATTSPSVLRNILLMIPSPPRNWPGSNGNGRVSAAVNRWRTSKDDGPRSAAGSRLFCGKLGSAALVKNPDASSVDLPNVYDNSIHVPFEGRC